MARVPKLKHATGPDGAPPPSGSRVHIRRTPDGLGIYNPSRLKVPLVLFLLLWLGGWAAGEWFAITELMRGGVAAGLFMVIWLPLWTMAGLFCMWTVLWSLFGAERLFVTGGALVRLWGVGPLRRRRVYPVAEMSGLRGTRHVHGSNAFPVSAIEFEAAGKTCYLGRDMDPQERDAVLAALREVLPQQVFEPAAPPQEA